MVTLLHMWLLLAGLHYSLGRPKFETPEDCKVRDKLFLEGIHHRFLDLLIPIIYFIV